MLLNALWRTIDLPGHSRRIFPVLAKHVNGDRQHRRINDDLRNRDRDVGVEHDDGERRVCKSYLLFFGLFELVRYPSELRNANFLGGQPCVLAGRRDALRSLCPASPFPMLQVEDERGGFVAPEKTVFRSGLMAWPTPNALGLGAMPGYECIQRPVKFETHPARNLTDQVSASETGSLISIDGPFETETISGRCDL